MGGSSSYRIKSSLFFFIYLFPSEVKKSALVQFINCQFCNLLLLLKFKIIF